MSFFLVEIGFVHALLFYKFHRFMHSAGKSWRNGVEIFIDYRGEIIFQKELLRSRSPQIYFSIEFYDIKRWK